MGALGRMRDRVQIGVDEPGRNAFGEATLAPRVIAEVPAEVIQTGGVEVQREGRVESQTVYTVKMRFHPGLTEKGWLQFEEKRLNIDGVIDPDGRGEWLEVACRS